MLKPILRSLLKNPGFTAVAVLTLALGIGMNTSMFSFVNALLLRPLPYPDAEQLTRVHRTTTHGHSSGISPADFLDLKREQAAFGRFAGYHQSSLALSDSASSVSWMHVTADLFDVLGLRPTLGRSFRTEEETVGNDRVVILSHRSWLDRFGGAKEVIGQTIRGNDQTFEIIGVMPAAATDHRLFGQVEMFSPMSLTEAARHDREARWINVLGRRNKSVSATQGAAFIETLGARLAADFPNENGSSAWRGEGLTTANMSPTGKSMMAMLLGLSGLVLLIACSNLANLLLARVVAGTRELAVRAALGASRVRLLGPLALESLILAAAGGGGALLVSLWTTDWLRSVITGSGGPAFEFPMDWRVVGFATGMSLVTLLFFGIGPALFTLRINMNDTLKSGGRGATAGRSRQRFQHLLITGQFACAMILLAGAGFFVRGSINTLKQDYGWNSDNVVQGMIELPNHKYAGGSEINTFHRQLLDGVENIPGVSSASLSYRLPYLGLRSSVSFRIEGGDQTTAAQQPAAKINGITPSYFNVTKTPLIAGRQFNEADTASSGKVAIINDTLARTFFPDRSPLGQRIGREGSEPTEWAEIVGVVADVRSVDVAQPHDPFVIYHPMPQEPWHGSVLAVRTTGLTPGAALESIRAVVKTLDPDLVMRDPMTAKRAMEFVTSQMYLCQQLLLVFALLGLLLATLGVYSVLARLVAQRTSEIGIRMTLGAQMSDVIRLVLGSGLRIAIVGTLIGLLGAFCFCRLMAAMLPTMNINGGSVLAAATVLLISVALMACWIPARRAARVTPMEALRAE